jgi:hypothetical protein
MGNPYQGFLSPYKRKKKPIHSGWISTRRDEPHRGKGQGDERWADGGERSVSSTGCGRELGRILHSPAQDLEQIALLLGRVQFRCSTWEVNLGLHSRNTNDKHLEHLKMLYYRTADICESPSC